MVGIRVGEGKRKLEEEEESDGSESPIEESDGSESPIEESDGSKCPVRDYYQRDGTFIGSDGEEYYETDDDYIRYPDGSKMCIRHQDEYHKQVTQSEGFDITLDLTLGKRFGAPICPVRGKEKDPKYVELAQKSIEVFNSQHGSNYKFVKIETVNVSPSTGLLCYITLIANDSDDEDDESNASSKAFQALAFRGIDGETEVRFCRLKKPSDLIEGDTKTPDSDDDYTTL